MNTNTLVTSPDPTCAQMQTVTEVVFAQQVPVPSNSDPATTSPLLQDFLSVQMVTNALLTPPEPSICTVVVVATPKTPCCTNAAPLPVPVALKNTPSVQVQTNAPVSTPNRSSASMEAVAIVVATIQVPVRLTRHSPPAGS